MSIEKSREAYEAFERQQESARKKVQRIHDQISCYNVILSQCSLDGIDPTTKKYEKIWQQRMLLTTKIKNLYRELENI